MIRSVIYNSNNECATYGGTELLSRWDSIESGQWMWFDFENEAPDTESELLETPFKLNSLAIADAQRERHPPKFESFGQRIFLLLRDLPKEIDHELKPVQVAIFMDHNLLITRRSAPCEPLEALWTEAENDILDFAKGPAQIAYLLIRYIADRYTRTLLELETELVDLEDKLMNQAGDHLLSELVSENRKLKKMRRALSYQQNAIAAINRHDSSYIPEDIKHEFHDAY